MTDDAPRPTAHKGGTPWDDVRKLYEAGTSLRQLADRFGVRHQTIHQRAQKEGWIAVQATSPKKQAHMAELHIPDRPSEVSDLDLKPFDKAEQRVLAALQFGTPQNVACKAHGVDPKALKAPTKAPLVERMQAIAAQELFRAMWRASQRGDARTTQTLLERHELSKREFKPEQGKQAGGVSITIALDRSFGGVPAEIAPPTIDHEDELT